MYSILSLSERIHSQFILVKYRQLINSYAKSQNLPKRSYGVDYLKSSLYILIKKGADKKQSKSVLVGLAGHMANLIIYQMVVPFQLKAPENSKGYTTYREKITDESLDKIAEWLNCFSGDFIYHKNLISKLFEQYYPNTPQKDQTA